MKKVKKYYRIEFELTSPLSVGCGEDRVSDSDIVRDSRGLPYIPGTALAGVYRRLFTPETAEKYFGLDLTEERIRESSKKGRNVLTDSSVIVYDAHTLNSEKGVSVTRDMVALDEYKVAKPGAKFDFEVLEPGVTFVTYIEQNMDSADQQYVADEIALAWMKGDIRVGAKTARGYGHTKSVRMDSRLFDLSDETEREKWLDFDMYADTDEKGNPAWESVSIPRCLSSMQQDNAECEKIKKLYGEKGIRLAQKDIRTLCLDLKLRGGISVRKYSTDVGEADYVQLTETGDSQADAEGIPVIPGTSWAGVFRHHMHSVLRQISINGQIESRDTELDHLFGMEEKNGEHTRSAIRFTETVIEGGAPYSITQNAVDRFTQAPRNMALFTSRFWQGGEGELDITIEKKRIVPLQAQLLAVALIDLDLGLFTFGGAAGTGHGRCEIVSITVNETEVTERLKRQDCHFLEEAI